MNETILQIIPAPSDMWVEEKEDGSIYKSRVVCLALIEGEEESTGEKYRYVAPMDITPGDGVIDIVDGTSRDFKQIVFEGVI